MFCENVAYALGRSARETDDASLYVTNEEIVAYALGRSARETYAFLNEGNSALALHMH